MKFRQMFCQAAFAAFLLAAIPPGQAQVKTKINPDQMLPTLKVGQWFKMEGVVQKDATVLCTDVKILTGDFLDDDWGISAVVRNINREKQTFEIVNLPVKTQTDTEYENDEGTFSRFTDLRPGMLLDVEGTFLKDGTFLATEVEDESAKLKEEPDLKNEIEAVGKAEKIDVAKRTITVMGIVFRISDQTEFKSAVK